MPRTPRKTLPEFKHDCLASVTKLSDRDAGQQAVQELSSLIDLLKEDTLGPFVICLCSGDSDPTENRFARRETIRLFAEVADVHKEALRPHLPKIVGSVIRRLRTDDSQVQNAAADTLAMLAARCIPTSDNTENSLGVLLRPLLQALSEQTPCVQRGAARCVAAVARGSRPELVVQNTEKLLPRLIKHLNRPTCLSRAELLEASGAVVEITGAAVIPHIESLIGAVLEALTASDWTIRQSAVLVLMSIALNVDHSVISDEIDIVIDALEDIRFDKVRKVREVVQQCILLYRNTVNVTNTGEGEGGNQNQTTWPRARSSVPVPTPSRVAMAGTVSMIPTPTPSTPTTMAMKQAGAATQGQAQPPASSTPLIGIDNTGGGRDGAGSRSGSGSGEVRVMGKGKGTGRGKGKERNGANEGETDEDERGERGGGGERGGVSTAAETAAREIIVQKQLAALSEQQMKVIESINEFTVKINEGMESLSARLGVVEKAMGISGKSGTTKTKMSPHAHAHVHTHPHTQFHPQRDQAQAQAAGAGAATPTPTSDARFDFQSERERETASRIQAKLDAWEAETRNYGRPNHFSPHTTTTHTPNHLQQHLHLPTKQPTLSSVSGPWFAGRGYDDSTSTMRPTNISNPLTPTRTHYVPTYTQSHAYAHTLNASKSVTQAYVDALTYTPDDAPLIALMHQTGPVIDQLDPSVVGRVLVRVIELLGRDNRNFDIVFDWITQALDVGVEIPPDLKKWLGDMLCDFAGDPQGRWALRAARLYKSLNVNTL